jgi:hypothetical protein
MSARVQVEGKIYNIKSFGKVLSFTLSSSRKVKGEFVTDFFNAKILGQDNIDFFIGKNIVEKDRVWADGSLVVNSWEKDGVKKSSVEIIVNNIEKKVIPSFEGQSIEPDSSMPF